MKKILTALLISGFLSLGTSVLIAQDIHFSEFYFSPLTINPAQTGFFNGKHRIASNYKTQWKLASGGAPYVTYSGSYDVHVFDKQMKAADMSGFGVMVFSDKAGTGDLKTSGATGSLAYHRDLLGNGKQLMSFGIQAGFTQMSFDRTKLRTGNEILMDIPTGSGAELFESTSLAYIDVNAGILYNYIYSKSIKVFLGLSAFHLSKPQVNFLEVAESNVLSNRAALQFGGSFSLTREWDILPSALVMLQKASAESNVGMAIRYNSSDKAALRLGAWYRTWSNSDAAIIMAGMEYYNLTIGISYDMNISTLKETSKGQGSFEIAMIYILESNKSIVQDVACPHF